MWRLPASKTQGLRQLSTSLRAPLAVPTTPQSYRLVPTVRKLEACAILPTAITRSPLTRRTMSSDADYASFLDKANQDTGASNATAQSKTVKTKAVNTEVPKVLESVEEYYISDADEPFEPVSLKWDGDSLPSTDEFAKLLGHDSDVTDLDEKDFDPRGQYKSVTSAVREAGNGDIHVFRVHHGSTRAEYYVVSLDKKGGRIVGLKAISVES